MGIVLIYRKKREVSYFTVCNRVMILDSWSICSLSEEMINRHGPLVSGSVGLSVSPTVGQTVNRAVTSLHVRL